jgi:Caspase domain/Protein of unknown function (DUF1566)
MLFKNLNSRIISMKKLIPIITLILFTITLSSIQTSQAASRGLKISVSTQEGTNIDLYKDSYALIVGNGNYTNGWDPLPGAVRDVKEVADALERNGFNVKLMTDLTKDGFNREFAEFVIKHGRDKNNRLIFYYAGHGYTQKMANDEKLGYLVMVDTPAPETNPVGFSIKSVKMQSLVTDAKMIQAKHVLFIFDSCFSGTVLNLRDRITPNAISDNIKLPVRQFITAGRANESVPDYSVFKQCFLDILEGRDEEPIKDGYLTGEELGLYLKTKVPSYNKFQHPQYGKIKDPKLDKGDFVFLLGKANPEKSTTQLTTSTDAEKQKLSKAREEIERERRELEQLRLEFEKKKLIEDRKRLEDEKKAALARKTSKYEKKEPLEINDSEETDDSRFIVYKEGVVADMQTNLMWSTEDNGKDITWNKAKRYCEKFQRGGYSDWRMPTIRELQTLYDSGLFSNKKQPFIAKVTQKIKLSDQFVWSVDLVYSPGLYNGSPLPEKALRIRFDNGGTFATNVDTKTQYRALPVRNLTNSE